MVLFIKRRFAWLLIGLGILVLGCIEEFDAGQARGSDYLVVDAALDNTLNGRVVKLGLATQSFGFPSTQPVTNARVQLQVVNGATVSLSAVAGTYTLPAAFQFQSGSTYKLAIQLSDGRQYESGPELMPAAVPIQKLYRQYDPQGYQSNLATNTRFPAHNLLVDFQDPADQTNYYQWTFMLWERQFYCATCDNALYDGVSKCVAARTQATFDYGCNTACWQIFRSNSVNSTSDALFNGRSITGRLAGLVPYYQPNPCLVRVQQRNISAGAYRYSVILADQTQNTGGLADTPPAGLAGNIRNTANTKEDVLGYFSVAAVSEVLYWNDRSDVPVTAKPVGLLNGRLPNPEPSGVYGMFRPPLAPCIQSEVRTSIKPVGWEN